MEINKFNAGLITDASPLTSVENSSLDEDNMVLNIDGSRNRRLGMDYEEEHVAVSTTVVDAGTLPIAFTSFRWDNAGGIPDKSIIVIQSGIQVKFFHAEQYPNSGALIFTHTITGALNSQPFSYASVDGILVIASGIKNTRVFEFSSPNTITVRSNTLVVRDFWGVEDVVGGTDLLLGNDIQLRPTTNTNKHLYNLRNQSWGISRVQGNNENLIDPIVYFRDVSGGYYPSNSDTVNESLYPDAQDVDNRNIDRFFAFDLFRNAVGSSRAANGHYIIDALERGTSRYNNVLGSQSRYPELVSGGQTIGILNSDVTPGGPTAISEFAGRVWYGGFSSELTNGDKQSPKMASYILFSKVVENPEDIYRCYQINDPTAKEGSEILDTDGGFIRLNEAYDIKKIINLGSSLVVVAANGVWRIFGGSDNGFTATSYIVEKVSDRGCTSTSSVVEVDGSVIFWADDGIYHLTTNQVGDWVCNNISFGRIQRFYDNLDIDSKRNCNGAYDSYERKVRWVFENRTNVTNETRELVLDVQLQAYYTNSIRKYAEGNYPKVVGLYKGLPYKVSLNDTTVAVNADTVQVSAQDVVISLEVKLDINQREIGYIVVTGVAPTLSYSFSKYTNSRFRDWFSINNLGVDADAYMVTSYMSGEDFQRDKQVPYITVHLRRTEIGYDNDMNPLNPSSCLTQSRWGWANSDNSGKWGREFQAYRYRLLHLPLNSSDAYDNGFSIISSRNKLRGVGKVLSLRFRTEPDHNLHLYGWSMIFSSSENV